MIENWRSIATRAWSMLLMYAALIVGAVREVLPEVAPQLAPYLPAWVVPTIILLAAVARVLPQPDLPEEK